MYSISDQQIDFILDDLTNQGIRTESLRQNLLDHICILIEQNLAANGEFEPFYASVIQTFYRQELNEIEEATQMLASGKHLLILNRNQFFVLLFILFIGPFIAYDLLWLAAPEHSGGGLPYKVWGATLIFALFPLLNLIVLFLTPERFDPLIPRNSNILLGIKPLIRIIPGNENFIAR